MWLIVVIEDERGELVLRADSTAHPRIPEAVDAPGKCLEPLLGGLCTLTQELLILCLDST